MDTFPDHFSIIDFYVSICSQVKINAIVPDNFILLDVGKLEALKAAANFLAQMG